MTTVGTAQDYKHFLPRLLDLATQSSVIEAPIIALKLKMAEWRAWTKKEQQAVEEIFVYACVGAFKKHTDECLAGGWLVSLAVLNLAHERGREAAKGYSYKHSNLQNRADHRTQHKYDDFGRKNKERPVETGSSLESPRNTDILENRDADYENK